MDSNYNNNKELFEEVKKELKKALSHIPDNDLDGFLVKSGLKKSEEEKEAMGILENDNAKKHLCAALQTFSGDTVRLAEIVTTVILTLRAAGVIIVSVNLPTIIVIIVLILSIRIGISVYCAD